MTLRIQRNPDDVSQALSALRDRLVGELRDDDVHRALYATDASLYELVPVGVALPKTREDLVAIVDVCRQWRLPLVPRSGGTSLAGQAVGPGLVVDVGRYMNRIVDIDPHERTARVQPGVIRDDLNRRLSPHGLLFGPDTSTSNRAMIGGMIGNNSCGSQSIWFGTTRDNLIGVDIVTSDGRQHHVGECNREEWARLRERGGVLGQAMQRLEHIVGQHADAIADAFPKPSVSRRNTGYPLDDLANSWLGHNSERNPNLARFLCGTEGTLALTSEAVLSLAPTPGHKVLIAAHFDTIDESLRATVHAVKWKPGAVELMDKRILDLSKLNPEQDKNRWFVEGDPGAVLVIEFYGDTEAGARTLAEKCISALRDAGLGTAFPVISGAKMKSVWELRKAGLGVLMGKPGDVKPITIVEDTAVAVDDLPSFIRDFAGIMSRYEADCVYYAHASVGEIHVRPELNPKLPADIVRAKGIASEVADLVKAYRGSLSGEHGDGRLRGPYLEQVLGAEMVELLRDIKRHFDPAQLFNPGSVLTDVPMDKDWRFHPEYRSLEVDTAFRYDRFDGFQRAIEACNGAGECRKSAEAGGTMCPSYMVTKEERESTRGRANLFRRLLQGGPEALFGSEELKDALELCLSCKGCKRDCPASVDMATLKAEFEQGYQDRHGASIAARAFASVTELAKPAQWVPGAATIANAMQSTAPVKALMRATLGIATERTLPSFAPKGFQALWRRHRPTLPDVVDPVGRVVLFIDEFTDRYEPEIGLAAAELLHRGGVDVIVPQLGPSGRTHLSKGFVRDARRHIEHNLAVLEPYVTGPSPVDAIVGIEPSAVLTYIDESLELPSSAEARSLAAQIAAHVQLVEDFVVAQSRAGRWRAGWSEEPRTFLLHGHCHQKALVGLEGTRDALALPANTKVQVIPSGCCGMAGSFGYQAKHYETSMAIGELVLFPAVREAPNDTVVVAPGTSCRHQIQDGTQRASVHPVQALLEMLRPI